MSNNQKKIKEKIDNYLDGDNTSGGYISQQYDQKIKLRKNKIFNILLSKRKEIFHNNTSINFNDPRTININELKCDGEIKKDVDNYIKTTFDIRKWFKYFFSSNKNDIQVSLFLIQRFIILQLLEIKDKEQRRLSRNNTELIQKFCENLLNDDIKIIYNSCACLTNLTCFPKNIEQHIYREINLEKIIKFFNVVANNISILGSETLLLFINISLNIDAKVYLMKNSFFQNLSNFMNNVISNKCNIKNDKLELDTIKYCISIMSNLISICDFDDDYINVFAPMIPTCKIITSKYYANVDNIIFDENDSKNLIEIWKYFSKERAKKKEFVSEIIKENFTKILVILYNKIKDSKIRILILELFHDYLSINDDYDKILINDGIVKFFAKEIDRYQYSNVELLNIIFSCCSNLASGQIGQSEILFKSGVINKIIDITNFYINDNLDKEIRNLLQNSITCLVNIVFSDIQELKVNLLKYNNCSIINIFCKALKNEIEPSNKNNLTIKIIFAIKELNVASEELEPEMEKCYDLILINNSLENILNNYYESKNFNENVKDIINELIEFIKDKEKDLD